jgi:hypothetical protein
MTENTTIEKYVPDFGAEPERLRPVDLPQARSAYKIVLPGIIETAPTRSSPWAASPRFGP